jgi:hypothetical protein
VDEKEHDFRDHLGAMEIYKTLPPRETREIRSHYIHCPGQSAGMRRGRTMASTVFNLSQPDALQCMTTWISVAFQACLTRMLECELTKAERRVKKSNFR